MGYSSSKLDSSTKTTTTYRTTTNTNVTSNNTYGVTGADLNNLVNTFAGALQGAVHSPSQNPYSDAPVSDNTQKATVKDTLTSPLFIGMAFAVGSLLLIIIFKG